MLEETKDEKEHFKEMFLSLVVSLQSAAYMQLGKVPNPLTGEVQRDLEQARLTIDMVRMLRGKSSGNLSERESDFINKAIFELEMNYVEEGKKGTIIS